MIKCTLHFSSANKRSPHMTLHAEIECGKCSHDYWPTLTPISIKTMTVKMISAQHSSNNGKNWQKLSYEKILLAW